MWRISVTGIGFLVVATALVFYFLRDTQVDTTSDTSAVATTTSETAQARFVPYGLREYRNTAYRFSFLYPQELEVKEYIEGGNALTITFQNIKKQEGFQLFIVPYSEAQVSEERFRQDNPSGVRESLTNIVVDGATGAAFYGANPVLGETREAWFIHGGFLYEVTTLKPLGAWLTQIMQTWEFI